MIEASAGLLNDKVTVSLDGSAVIIKRGMVGRNERRIPLNRISEVAFKTGLAGGGYIEFVAAGVDGRVKFPPWKKAEFTALKEAADQAMAAGNGTPLIS